MDGETIYSGPVFDMARRQFDDVADRLGIPPGERERLLLPKRAIVVSCPIHRDDGRTEVFQGYRVQHHSTLGATKGGTRFALSVDIGEVAALAVWMSWKCALAELPYGGAKGGVTVDPRALSKRELETLSRRYMQEMIPFVGPHTDIMAPDLGTNEQVMAWFMDTYSMDRGHTVTEIVTGKPVVLGGTAGRREATGRGVAHLISRAMDQLGMNARKSTAIVQGFGNVGAVAAASLVQRGVTVVGISDRSVAYYDPAGINVAAAIAHTATNGELAGFSEEARIAADEFLVQKCDVLVPAALERTITDANVRSLQCRILAEGANGPTTPEADAYLNEHQDDVFVIPDILCNSGGVIVSYFEWVQDLQSLFWDESQILDQLNRKLERAFQMVLRRAAAERISHRQAALTIGVERVRQAKAARGLFP